VQAVAADEETARRLEVLRARADEPGWWDEYRPYMHQTLELLVEFDEEAIAMRTYDTVFVQGLVQTEDYARAIIESSRAFVRPIDVETLVELRMRRQARLAEPDFDRLTAVITEAVLHHQVGGRDVMRGQLQKLCDVTVSGLAAVHILRNDHGPWPGVGSFVIYSLSQAEGTDDTEIVYVDGDLGASIYESRDAVNAITYTFSAALAKALPARESVELCRALIRDL
jgi:hypothetical protein